MRKRILSALLCLTLLLSLILGAMPGTIQAQAVTGGEANKPVQEQPVAPVEPAPESGHRVTLELEPFRLGQQNATFQALQPALRNISASDQAAIDAAAAVLREAMVQRKNEINVELVVSGMDAETTAFAVYYAAQEHTGNPKEGDYIKWNGPNGTLSYSQTPVSGGQLTEVTYYLEYFTDAAQELEVDVAVLMLLNELNLWDATDFEKVCGVYTYLCHNITYDYEDIFEVSRHSTYTAIIYHHTVCQGYATLFYRLLLELGVDNRVITSIDHAWNIVELDGQYYNLDATWDAGMSDYSYFLCGSADFPEHPPEDEYLTEEFIAQYPISVNSFGANGPAYVVNCHLTLDALTLNNGAYYTADGYQAFIALDAYIEWLGNNGTLKDYVEAYGDYFFSLTYWDQLEGAMNVDGYVPLTEETLVWMLDLITGNPQWEEDETYLTYYLGYQIPASGDYDDSHVHDHTACYREPTCFMHGYTYYYCECGDIYAEYAAPVLEHDYQTFVTAPDCVEEGFTTFDCERCWYSYVDAYVEALGHDYVDGYCNRCGMVDPGHYVAHGDRVMIYYPAGDSYITAYASGSKLQAGTMDDAAVWAVEVDENGFYSFLVDGLYLTSGATGNQLYLSEVASDYSLWELIGLGNGDFYIRNVNAYYNGTTPQYLEYYSGFTTYGYNAANDYAYLYRFVVTEGAQPHEHQYQTIVHEATCIDSGYTYYYCVCGDEFTADYVQALGHDYVDDYCSRCGQLDPSISVAHGDRVMIYYPAGDSYITAYASGSKLQAGSEDEAAVWAVEVDENGFYSFLVDGLYLTSGATGNQLYLSEVASDYSLWELIGFGNGDFYIRNVNAYYNGTTPQYLEYYSGFTTYGYNAANDYAYIYRFVVTEGAQPHEHQYQTIVHEATCIDSGYTYYYCACGDEFTADYVQALGHSYVDGVCERCGEADPNAVVMGDANGDGQVNYLDAMLIAQFYVGDIEEDELDLAAADVNGDGDVDYLDAMMVAQYYVGDIDSFPAED